MKLYIQDNGHLKQAAILRERIAERIPLTISNDGMPLTLCIDSALAPESYQISPNGAGFLLSGGDELGLYYAVGKALHAGRWSKDSFTPVATQGVVTAACSFRAIYYAVHFYNWYQNAPSEALERYLEDLLLWGYNAAFCIMPVINLSSFDEPLAATLQQNIRRLLHAAKTFGMKTGIIICPNQGLKTAPHEYDAEITFDLTFRGNAGRNLCPSNPAALDYLREIWKNMLLPLSDFSLDYIITWPYDEGGCSCEKCHPWGAKGYPNVANELHRVASQIFPNAKYIVSTWAFDVPESTGEYEGLYERLKKDLDWVDYLMVDAHRDFPAYALEHTPVKPIVNFPEISMWGLAPWGGFGATPLLERFQRIWDSAKHILQGGMPYSEGIYEDISKVQCACYYWEPDRNYRDILAEYVNFEFGNDIFEDVLTLCLYIEKNHAHIANKEDPECELALRAAELARGIDARLDERAKRSWRWRILFIRAILDEKRYPLFPYGSDDEKKFRRFRLFSGDLLLEDEQAQAMFLELWGYYHCVPHNGENHHTLPPYGGTKLQVKI